jgi:MerR family redox-sensitive transcriptional activator SoxR
VKTMSIGQVAKRAGLAPSAIRYYEREGLVPETQRLGGKRRYADDVLIRLALIRVAQNAGFTIAEVRTLIDGFPDGTPPGDRWKDLARRKLPEVDALIARLRTVRVVLEESLRCDCLTLDACAVDCWSTGETETVTER